MFRRILAIALALASSLIVIAWGTSWRKPLVLHSAGFPVASGRLLDATVKYGIMGDAEREWLLKLAQWLKDNGQEPPDFQAKGWEEALFASQKGLEVSISRRTFTMEWCTYEGNASQIENPEIYPLGFHYERWLGGQWEYSQRSYPFGWYTRICVPCWVLMVILGPYPIFWFLRGPMRSWHRLRRGQCIKCGYNLTGNTSGVCPECGTARR